MSFELYANARKRNEKCTLEMKMNSGDTPSPGHDKIENTQAIRYCSSRSVDRLERSSPPTPPPPPRHGPVT